MQMAGLGYSEEQIELLDVATSFCRDKSPIARVRKLMDSDLGYDADVWAEMAALGWTAISIPEAHGGVGLTLAEVVPVVEQMGRHLMASPLASSTLAAQALIIAQAVGGRGPNRDYLYATAQHLADLGIEDPDLSWLAAEVRKIS